MSDTIYGNLTSKPLSPPYMDLSKLAPNPNRQQAQADLNTFYQTRTSPSSYLDQAYNQFGVNDARSTLQANRKSIDNTTNLLEAVAPSVKGRIAESLVTDAQRKRLQTVEEQPLRDSLSKQQGIYNTSYANLQDVLGQAQNWATSAYQTDENMLAALLQRLQSAQYEEEQRAKAAEAAALQNVFRSYLTPEQVNAQANAVHNSVYSGLPNLRVTSNAGGFQSPNYNPQQTFNPQRTATVQSTGTVQNAVNPQSWFNNYATSNLRVTNPTSKSTVSVTPTKRATNVSVTPTRTGTVSVR